MIHPTAIVHAKARLDPSVQVGPYAIIDEHVVMGPGCRVGPHVYLTGHTVIGANNRFFANCVIGEAPQDLKYKGGATHLRIGDNNIFREGVTVHRSNKLEEDTIIGSHNFLMANSHVAHNVILGDHIILVNGALLAGHVTVSDRALISGNAAIHQFVRIGTLALVQGGARITKDVPPFTVASGLNGICGLNIIGLRRAEFTAPERLELKKLYRAVFRGGQNLSTAAVAARKIFTSKPSKLLLDFLASSKRGTCSDIGQVASEKANDEAAID